MFYKPCNFRYFWEIAALLSFLLLHKSQLHQDDCANNHEKQGAVSTQVNFQDKHKDDDITNALYQNKQKLPCLQSLDFPHEHIQYLLIFQ